MKDKYVIVANVLFSTLISGKRVYRLLFSEHTIYLPDFAFLEIEKYRQQILKIQNWMLFRYYFDYVLLFVLATFVSLG